MAKGSSLTVNKNTVTLRSPRTGDRWCRRKNEINFNKGFHHAADPGGQRPVGMLMTGSTADRWAQLQRAEDPGNAQELGTSP